MLSLAMRGSRMFRPMVGTPLINRSAQTYITNATLLPHHHRPQGFVAMRPFLP